MAAARWRELLAGTGTLYRLMLRRDRIKLPAWVIGAGLYIMYLAQALPTAFSDPQQLEDTMSMFVLSPVGRMLVGPGYGFDNVSFQQVIGNGYALYLFLMTAIMSIFIITRHTRAEEQTGRAELIHASVVGRLSLLTAALGVALTTNLLAAGMVFLMMTGLGGFDVTGSLILAAAAAAVGMAFAGVTAVTVQLTEYSRVAAASAGAVLGTAFVVRAGGDMAAQGGSTLSWLSPLGWAQQTAPFVLDRWWPLGLIIAWTVITVAIGYVLLAKRDVGASFIAARAGRAYAKPKLGTPLGLALRLQRTSLVGWSAALAITGITMGAYADGFFDSTLQLPEVFLELFGGSEGLLTGYLAYMAKFMGYLTAIYAIIAILSMRREELSGRAETVLATPVSRTKWLGSMAVVTTGGVVVMMALAGLTTGLGAALVIRDTSYIWPTVTAHLNSIPPVLVMLALAVLLYGAMPRAMGLVWALLGYSFFMGNFAGLIGLPEWLLKLSPYSHVADMPLEKFAPLPVAVLLGLTAVFILFGATALRRREINVR